MTLREALTSPQSERRASACREAATDPTAVVWIDALAQALADPAGAVRQAACDALASIGRDHDVAPALKQALHGNDPHGRWGAAQTLARLAPPQPALIPAAVEALESRLGSERWSAARLLVELGRLHGDVLPLLVGLAHSGDSRGLRRMALFCLRELAPDDPAACEALLASTDAREVGQRRAAFTALAGLIDPPPAVLDPLARAAQADPDPSCRELAARALDELTHPVTRRTRA